MPFDCIKKQEETRVVIVKMKGLKKNQFSKIGGKKPHLCRAKIRDDSSPWSVEH